MNIEELVEETDMLQKSINKSITEIEICNRKIEELKARLEGSTNIKDCEKMIGELKKVNQKLKSKAENIIERIEKE